MELELRGITKRFPGVVANDNVNLTVRGGEVLALLGENGAGKSTLMNILYGLYRADEGEILIDGETVHFTSPRDAIKAGIGMVHQHFMLVPNFSVADNVILGVEPTISLGRINRRAARKRVAQLSRDFGLDLDPDALTETLAVGIQQRIEIVKVLFRDAKVVVFDEPTAVLTPQEIEDFFRIVETLKAAGCAVVFITHKLKEAIRIADRIVVLRRGKTVGEADPKTATQASLAQMMVGRPVELVVNKVHSTLGELVLDVKDLTVADPSGRALVNGASLEVRVGEIVGIAGIQGNGQSELVEALVGMRRPANGTITLTGTDITHASVRERHAIGIAHIPEDRQRDGLVKDFTLTENFALTAYYAPPLSKGINMDWDAARTEAARLVEAFDIRTPSTETSTGKLSGGNQQKVIVAREISRPI
ncbi:MAG: heme transporter ATP-binding protein, partial [Ilumatobacteraceae bacterium]|nr:heme transporter ATP-binding protein [Ilumatobacteraceae bacterium]